MAITTDIALSEKESIVYKKFKSLSVNEEPKPQGEGVIRISPFDDYFIFTIYDETDGVNQPIDLTNVGTLYMVFIGTSDEIRIPNYTNVQNVDMSAGQVLFRIDSDDAKKILALNDKNFYISTMMTDPDGQSDESVLYTGTFLSFTEAAQASLSDQLETLRIQYAKEVAALQDQITKLNTDNASKDQLISEQTVIINALKESNKNLSDEIGRLTEIVGSAKAAELLAVATATQKAEEIIKKQREQLESLKKIENSAVTKSQEQAYFIQASQQLQTSIPGIAPIYTGGGGGGGRNSRDIVGDSNLFGFSSQESIINNFE